MTSSARAKTAAIAAIACAALLAACTAGKGTSSSPSKPSRRELAVRSKSTKLVKPLAKPPRGPFGLSLVASLDKKPTKIKAFALRKACAECHPRQYRELEGSMHSISHRDSLYRRSAEQALKEAGPAVYAYCSGCHTPQGVASKLVPTVPEAKLPENVKAGILCDTCHSITKLTGTHGPWREPGNASFVLAPDSERKFAPAKNKDADHEVKARPFMKTSEFCASCHTVIHPFNGVRVEHTYAEWKRSIYAKKGIQCQDCHMRTVAQSRKVAATLKRVVPRGKSSEEGKVRAISPHFFVGGNANADKLGGGKVHAKMAAARLASAARLTLARGRISDGGRTLRFRVAVENVGAGHNLPTSLTELREIWVDLEIKAADGRRVFRSGALDKRGDIDPTAMRFGAKAADKNGKLTYKLWEVNHFTWKRLIPPKAKAVDEFTVPLPAGIKGPLTIAATLRYRSAPPRVLKTLFGDKPPALRTVTMAQAKLSVPLAK